MTHTVWVIQYARKRKLKTILNFCALSSVDFDMALIKATRLSFELTLAIISMSARFRFDIPRNSAFVASADLVKSVFPDALWPWNLKNRDRFGRAASAKRTIAIKTIFKFMLLFLKRVSNWCFVESYFNWLRITTTGRRPQWKTLLRSWSLKLLIWNTASLSEPNHRRPQIYRSGYLFSYIISYIIPRSNSCYTIFVLWDLFRKTP